ncbi:FAD binding domain-containing protein [Bisporella sp. PMI_857]|nr:FAD binding domain-containing protein [Bisporella sp. PMI_857]
MILSFFLLVAWYSSKVAGTTLMIRHSSCVNACNILNSRLPGRVSFPGDPVFVEESKYWSTQQASVVPTCRVSPTNVSEVSTAILALKAQSCYFAVKSGGHACFAGASNIDEGVTIDLANLKQIAVSNDRKQVSVGPGNRWMDVYGHLDPLGLSVIGGRVGDIGVGGLTLGGGISFFSGRYGLACDNVNNYQVVFANGEIHDVNLQTFPDLFWALRGGGNNFGIVTRFDLKSFSQGDLWRGRLTWTYDKTPEVLKALSDFTQNHAEDVDATLFVAVGYLAIAGGFATVAELEYGKPVINPPILQPFTNISSVAYTSTISNLTQLTIDQLENNPSGFRETYWTCSFRNNFELMDRARNILREEFEKIIAVPDVLPVGVFQPISSAIISHMSEAGGNALGIDASDAPLINFHVSLRWSNVADDAIMMQTAATVISRVNEAAKEKGLHFPWIYQNYAAKQQNVFRGYGETSHQRLRDISRKYDPQGVFTKLQPGYFKI